MPRFITVTVGCDWPSCTTTGVEGEDIVVPKTLAVDGRQGRTFLICKQHLDDLDETLAPLLAAGVKVETAPKRSKTSSGTPAGTSSSSSSPSAEPSDQGNGPITCRACGRDNIKNKTGMAQHVTRSHNFESLAAYEAEFNVKVT